MFQDTPWLEQLETARAAVCETAKRKPSLNLAFLIGTMLQSIKQQESISMNSHDKHYFRKLTDQVIDLVNNIK